MLRSSEALALVYPGFMGVVSCVTTERVNQLNGAPLGWPFSHPGFALRCGTHSSNSQNRRVSVKIHDAKGRTRFAPLPRRAAQPCRDSLEPLQSFKPSEFPRVVLYKNQTILRKRSRHLYSLRVAKFCRRVC